jgi:hypothetical protein
MHVTGIRIVLALGLSAGLAVTSSASVVTGFARLTHTEGAVTLHRAHVPVSAPAGAMLQPGDEVKTNGGRAEVEFPDGSLLHVDRDSRVVFIAADQFAVTGGRVFFRTSEDASGGYQVNTEAGRLRLQPRGVFGILAQGRNRHVLLTVAVGAARVDSSWGSTPVAARQMALVAGPTGHPFLTPYFPERTDSFEVWSSTRVLGASYAAAEDWNDGPAHGGVVIDHYRESSLGVTAWSPYGALLYTPLFPRHDVKPRSYGDDRRRDGSRDYDRRDAERVHDRDARGADSDRSGRDRDTRRAGPHRRGRDDSSDSRPRSGPGDRQRREGDIRNARPRGGQADRPGHATPAAPRPAARPQPRPSKPGHAGAAVPRPQP